MAGLGGLTKTDRELVEKDLQAADFIKGATRRVAALTPSQATYKRVMFSLTEQDSAEIERLSLVPRDFRATRSDVVKAAVAAFSSLPEAEQLRLLKQVK